MTTNPESKPHCTCGEFSPDHLVVHRTDGPCYLRERESKPRSITSPTGPGDCRMCGNSHVGDETEAEEAKCLSDYYSKENDRLHQENEALRRKAGLVDRLKTSLEKQECQCDTSGKPKLWTCFKCAWLAEFDALPKEGKS